MEAKNNKIETVLFDLDGTLINTMDLITLSFLHTLEIYFPDRHYTREEVQTFIGPPLSETFGRLNPGKEEEMITEYRKFNHANHDRLVTPYEGVTETLEQLHAEGRKMAIVTSKRRDTAIKGLELMDLTRFFPVIVSLDEVTKHKPDPEPLDIALEQLDAERSSAMMVGDSEHDILSGQNAGMLTAGVAWSIKGREHLAAYRPNIMLEKMPDLLDYINNG
ncbi:pyrophosphatase PpaX [Salisediminibacterium halotolerans]|uniref:Pyrophosphatase PpaX n=1 Tax=Salisediminibacterium halotolerans TaxID=517425 RepID=A0A1H9W1G2_9BACI|nr:MULTISPECIES: pyrophosphatase PpaX [Salisediminibacterium]RLJ75463.1 pyrophosphatase PpaX [Actinophytocola xinjiangensis]RPE89316.1 pyrophosphatase PpaX [Salisediminibacterium halotolerans]TWG36076.1 pyrophosphatase PpaX [Salisediminibacterium halotolerans]SES27611.1 pyrophosphatase PpaX [Salisediminibacterium haloalkalitolerans]GEL07839.1 pyrophosphatase PpaX [Salisediminibacterium halotolerans]